MRHVTFEENLMTPPFNGFGEESMLDLSSYSWFRGCSNAIPHINTCTVEINLSEKLASHLLELRQTNITAATHDDLHGDNAGQTQTMITALVSCELILRWVKAPSLASIPIILSIQSWGVVRHPLVKSHASSNVSPGQKYIFTVPYIRLSSVPDLIICKCPVDMEAMTCFSENSTNVMNNRMNNDAYQIEDYLGTHVINALGRKSSAIERQQLPNGSIINLNLSINTDQAAVSYDSSDIDYNQRRMYKITAQNATKNFTLCYRDWKTAYCFFAFRPSQVNWGVSPGVAFSSSIEGSIEMQNLSGSALTFQGEIIFFYGTQYCTLTSDSCSFQSQRVPELSALKILAGQSVPQA